MSAPDPLPLRPEDPRILAVRAGLTLLCQPKPCRARVRGGTLVYYWHASQRRRDADIRRALGRRIRKAALS